MSKIHFSALLFLSTASSLVFAKTTEHLSHTFAASNLTELDDLATSLTVSLLIIAVYALYWLKQKI